MFLKDLENYINSQPNLKKIDPSLEYSEDHEEFFVTKTKETYIFVDEVDADTKVDAVRRDVGFAGVEKKFKAGKMNKSGEVVRPDMWIVVVKLNK